MSYSSYLGASKCCSLRVVGPVGPQGTQGKKGAIGPAGNGPSGPTGPQGALSVTSASSGNIVLYNSSTPSVLGQSSLLKLDSLGNIIVTNNCYATAFYATSDHRIKTYVDTEVDTTFLNDLRPVRYFNNVNQKTEYGFIAHELQRIIPELVEGEKDGEQYQRINYTGIIPFLVKKIQENDALVKSLEERISILENKTK